jgi:HlyD family secretion protein
MKARFGWIALAAIVLAMSGCVDRGKQAQAKKTQELISSPVRPVTVEPVQIKSVSQTLSVTGEVTTSQDTQVGSKRSGRLSAVLVNDGDTVKAGQLLATLDNSDIQNQLAQALAAMSGAQAQYSQARLNAAIGPSKTSASIASAQAQLRSAQAALKKAQAGARPEERIQVDWQVKSAKSNLDTAQKDLERKKALVAQGALAKSELDVSQNAYMAALTSYNAALQTQALTKEGTRSEDLMVAQEGVRSAEGALAQAKAAKQLDPLLSDAVVTAKAQVDTAQAQINIAKQALADTQIRAPFDGRIAGKPMQPGTVVSPGQGIVRLIGSTGLYFEGDVPESAVESVQPGKTTSVKIDALPGRTFVGYVVNVSPVSQDLGRLFQARIQINGDLSGVKPGMFAAGDILLKSIPNAMVVPASAVVQRDGKNVVFIVDGNKAHQVEVQTGLKDGADIQVQGLVAGQQVVVRGMEDLVDGTPVQAQPQTVADARVVGGG